jgi:hypothetical protein
MGTADIALFATGGRARVRFFTLLTTTGKLWLLLFLTVDTGLHFFTFSAIYNLFTTPHFICLFTAWG